MTSSNSNRFHNNITEVVLKQVPKEAEISRIKFEGPSVAVYTMRPEVLIEQSYIVTYIVGLIKKRIVVRSDPSVRIPEVEAEKLILGMVSKEADSPIIFIASLTHLILGSSTM